MLVKPTKSDFENVPTKDGYDLWSQIYDSEDNPLISLESENLPPLLESVSGLNILDVGCGTGRQSFRLSELGATVCGIDFSDGMLEKARRKPNAEKVKFVFHDFNQGLPFTSDLFDVVISCLVFDHVKDPLPLMKEMRRVCKPSGEIIISVMHPAMMLLGVQARFTHPGSGMQIRPESASNKISDYVMASQKSGLKIEFIGEYEVDEKLCERSPRAQKYLGWPLLLLMKLLK
ncbi:MAG: class I SAM-dependent methyltransferase [Candidatus Riflebacteria bacterium]|nr:class I SAM-dependent methyltransferase [Candidatus Riflebacteria bacterium]